jgi:hypothetical protein
MLVRKYILKYKEEKAGSEEKVTELDQSPSV